MPNLNAVITNFIINFSEGTDGLRKIFWDFQKLAFRQDSNRSLWPSNDSLIKSTDNSHNHKINMFLTISISHYWQFYTLSFLIHWGRVTHICVSDLTSIGSDNGLSPGLRQAIIRTNAGILLIGPLGTNLSEILIEILIFSFKKMRMKVSSAKRRPFCLGLNVLKDICGSVLLAWNLAIETCHSETPIVSYDFYQTCPKPPQNCVHFVSHFGGDR